MYKGLVLTKKSHTIFIYKRVRWWQKGLFNVIYSSRNKGYCATLIDVLVIFFE